MLIRSNRKSSTPSVKKAFKVTMASFDFAWSALCVGVTVAGAAIALRDKGRKLVAAARA